MTVRNKIGRGLAAVFCGLTLSLASFPVTAMTYFQDPVFVKPNDETPHPLGEVLHLAENYDVRAAFILGDLYEKGKGGMPKNAALSQEWFEKSAMGGYAMSFVRLAAKAKNEKKFVEAYQWYSLALDYFKPGPTRFYIVRARNELIKSAELGRDDLRRADKAMVAWNRQQRDWQAKMRAAQAAEKAAQREQEKNEKQQAKKIKAPQDVPQPEPIKKGGYNG